MQFCYQGSVVDYDSFNREAEILMTSATLGLIINFKDGFRQVKKELNKADEY